LERLKKVWGSPFVFPVFLVILTAVFLPVRGLEITPDSAWYLNNALDIKENQNLESLIIRRPLYPFMIALFNASIEGGFRVSRIFFALNILLCYFLGLRLFNRRVGMIFSMLVFTSYPINVFSARMLVDHIIVFFVLLFAYLVYIGVEKKSNRHFIGAGVVLGLLFLLKEVIALFYVPLPLLLLVYKKYRGKECLKGMGLLYMSCLVVLIPWLYYILFKGHSVQLLLGPLADVPRIGREGFTVSAANLWNGFIAAAANFFGFVKIYIYRYFHLIIFFTVGGGYTLYRAFFKKERSSGLLLVILALSSPLVYVAMISQGVNFRPGQLMILYFLYYFFLAIFLGCGFQELTAGSSRPTSTGWTGRFRWLSAIDTNRKVILYSLASVLTAYCLLSQLFIGGGGKYDRSFYSGLMKTKMHYGFSFRNGNLRLEGMAGEPIREASQWLLDNLDAAAPILCQSPDWEVIDFFTQHRYQIQRIQSYRIAGILNGSAELEVLGNRARVYQRRSLPVEALGRPLFIWTIIRALRTRGNYFVGYFEKAFLDQVRQFRARYVITFKRYGFFNLYLRQHPAFKRIKQFAGGYVQVYEVISHQPGPLDGGGTKFELSMYKYFRVLFEQHRNLYQAKKSAFEQIFLSYGIQTGRLFTQIEQKKINAFIEADETVRAKMIYR
jgi:hypothetical protein